MSKFLRRIALAAPIAAAGLILGLTIPSVGSSGSSAIRPRPERELVQAQLLAGFRLHLPAWLPKGAELDRVSWAEPGADRRVTSVDVWYRTERARIHVWQTNQSSLEKDVIGSGTAVTIAGRKWWREPTALGTSLTTTMPDGVTLQITAKLSDEVLERIAASVRS